MSGGAHVPIVLFDVMDTLVHDPFRNEMPAFFGTDLAGMMRDKHPRAWIEFELAERDEADFLRSFFADGRDFDHDAFRRVVFESYRLLPGIEPLLERLRARGVAMHAASNYPTWYRAVEQRTQLSRFLSWSFVSCELGVRKPDPAFFGRALERLGQAASDCVFVDDQPRNVEAALRLGFDAVLFEGAERLEHALCARGLLDPDGV